MAPADRDPVRLDAVCPVRALLAVAGARERSEGVLRTRRARRHACVPVVARLAGRTRLRGLRDECACNTPNFVVSKLVSIHKLEISYEAQGE